MYEKELIAFSESGARYLVIGAVALGLSGYPRATSDLDIMPDLSSENLEKIITVLDNLSYKPRLPIQPEELKDPLKREEWYKKRNMRVFSFIDASNPINTIDLMIYHPLNFEECYQRKQIKKLKDTNIYVASVFDLLKLKKIAMRDIDIGDISILEEMVKESKNG